MTAADGTCLLAVKDNGVGVRDGGRVDRNPSLGLEIVDTLCNQLGGKYSLRYGGGTEFRLEFQVPEERASDRCMLARPIRDVLGYM